MFKKNQYASACLLVFAAACASAPAATNTGPAELSAEAQETLDRFEPTGETRACVPTRRIRDVKPLSNDLLLVRVGTNDYYLNRPTSTCQQATSTSSTLRYQIDGVPNLCTGETVNVVSNRSGSAGIVLGGCALGEFEALQEKDAG